MCSTMLLKYIFYLYKAPHFPLTDTKKIGNGLIEEKSAWNRTGASCRIVENEVKNAGYKAISFNLSTVVDSFLNLDTSLSNNYENLMKKHAKDRILLILQKDLIREMFL